MYRLTYILILCSLAVSCGARKTHTQHVPNCIEIADVVIPKGCYALKTSKGLEVRCPNGTVTYNCGGVIKEKTVNLSGTTRKDT
jgi:hypothetical protein